MSLCSLGFTCTVTCTFSNWSLCRPECTLNFPQPAGSQSYYVHQKLCTPAIFDRINFGPNSKFNNRVLLLPPIVFQHDVFVVLKTIAGRRRLLVLNAEPARMSLKRIVSSCSTDTDIQKNTHTRARARRDTHRHISLRVAESRINYNFLRDRRQ